MAFHRRIRVNIVLIPSIPGIQNNPKIDDGSAIFGGRP